MAKLPETPHVPEQETVCRQHWESQVGAVPKADTTQGQGLAGGSRDALAAISPATCDGGWRAGAGAVTEL